MPIYKEVKQHPLGGKTFGILKSPIIGEDHFVYSSDKGSISLILLPNYFLNGKDLWEIYSLEGDLFDDVERFPSFKKAEERVHYYLRSPKRSRMIRPENKRRRAKKYL